MISRGFREGLCCPCYVRESNVSPVGVAEPSNPKITADTVLVSEGHTHIVYTMVTSSSHLEHHRNHSKVIKNECRDVAQVPVGVRWHRHTVGNYTALT